MRCDLINLHVTNTQPEISNRPRSKTGGTITLIAGIGVAALVARGSAPQAQADRAKANESLNSQLMGPPYEPDLTRADLPGLPSEVFEKSGKINAPVESIDLTSATANSNAPHAVQNPSGISGWWSRLMENPTNQVILGITLFAAVTSGIKRVYAVYIYRKNRKNYNEGVSVQTPAFNLHIIKENQDGSLRLKTRAGERLDTSKLLDNMTVRHIFNKALKLCTLEQRFPSLNIETAMKGFWVSKKDIRSGDHALQVLNKCLRDHGSALCREGHDDDDFGLPVKEMVRYMIPICEVKKRGGRELSVIVISAENFERFKDPRIVERFKSANSKVAGRIKTLAAAYSHHAAFLRQGGKDPDAAYHLDPGGEMNPDFRDTDYLFARLVVTNKVRHRDLVQNGKGDHLNGSADTHGRDTRDAAGRYAANG